MAVVSNVQSQAVRTIYRRTNLAQIQEGGVRLFSLVSALVSIATTLGILLTLFTETLIFFKAVSPYRFLTEKQWTPAFEDGQFGIMPLLVGTFQIALFATLVALPLGLLTAVYLSEYAHPRTRAIVKPALELLAGIPSVVFGFVAFFMITPALKVVFPNIDTMNGLSGGVVVGIMVLPLISSLCQDAISAVPKALREAAYGLGSTKLETITRVVLPAALSGVTASLILAISRAIGETMAVTLAAGATPSMSMNPLKSTQTMTAAIVNLASGDVSRDGPGYHSIFAVAFTLFVITFVMNLLANRLVRRYRQVYT